MKSVISLIALIVHGVGFSFYLYMLYYSGYPAVYVKGCMYIFMAIMHVYLVISEWGIVQEHKQMQFNTINKCLFIFNFILIAATIFGIFDGVTLMICYGFAVSLTSMFILHSGLQHDYFKDENT